MRRKGDSMLKVLNIIGGIISFILGMKCFWIWGHTGSPNSLLWLGAEFAFFNNAAYLFERAGYSRNA